MSRPEQLQKFKRGKKGNAVVWVACLCRSNSVIEGYEKDDRDNESQQNIQSGKPGA